ncbi:MAG: glycosyltransferase family 39 protein [Clostridia bacterium]|nr:glycosyltransferase family 39 protein [Clostridia bacterium]
MKKIDKLENIAATIIKIIFLILIVFLLIYSIMESANIIYTKLTNEHTVHNKDNVIVNILGIMLTCIIATVVRVKRIKISKNVVYVCMILWFVISVAWIFMTDLSPKADSLFTLNSAEEILRGDYSALKEGGYLYVYPQQYGLTLFFCLISLVFKRSAYLIIQLINVFVLSLVFFCVYKIVQILFNNEKISRCVLLVLICFVPISMYITFVYGNLIGLAFSCLAILFQIKYLQNEKKRYILGIAFFASLAVLIKSNYLINLIAIILLFIYEMIFKNKLKYIVPIFLVIVCYVAMTYATNFTMKSITGIERNKGTPTVTWIAMGMQEGPMAQGWYNQYNLNTYVKSNYDYEKTSEKAKKNIKKSISEFKKKPNYAVKFFVNKTLSQWNNPTFQCIWINLYRKPEHFYNPIVKSVLTKDGKLGKALTKYTDIMQTLILFGTTMYIVLDFKKIKMKELIFAIIFIGGFIFHIVWEAKCQYAITYFVLLIPYSVLGYYKIGNKINKIIDLRRKNA